MNNSLLSFLLEMEDIWQTTLNSQLTTRQKIQFQRLYELILQGNLKLNLTRIIEPQDFWEKHLWDSLRGVVSLLSNSHNQLSVIDIGTGGGFPGIPFAIMLPNSQVNLLDSTQKKVTFLTQIIPELELHNVTTTVGRAEKIGHNPKYREQYDVALIRAVSNTSACIEYTLPLIKKGGLAIIYRGNWMDYEITSVTGVAKQLGGVIAYIDKFKTPLSQGTRHCLYLKKITKTSSKFPRPIGIPNSKPL
ncbi:rRNA small subunit methyltransferase, glucose inhibited division protein GidB [Richelia intracellularis HH01]|uniref:Ribosomal RNA small subunit methyltransferase G n=2 Tax=Richelia TaxID=98443 RepID=M1X5J4_9NOST|nr:rRNA small subunit methyltransferase, glucose inhibited division protein GidB [Richelia intracellularis HH01]